MKVLSALESRGVTLPIILIAALWIGAVAYLALSPTPVTSPCLFKRLTGQPCATCGSTRAVIRLLHADLLAAFRLNPLVTLLIAAVPVYALFRGLFRGRVRFSRCQDAPQKHATPTRSNLLLVVGLALLALNWAYLIWDGR